MKPHDLQKEVEILELRKTDGPFPKLDYSYVTDKHYALYASRGMDGWKFELSLRNLPEAVSKKFQSSLFKDHIEEPRVFSVKAEGEIIGWMELSLEKWNNRLRIWELLVREDFRRKGIGSKLVNRAVEVAREKRARMIVLETQSCNVSAIGFYLRHGFELIGFDSAAYSNQDIGKGEVRLEFGLEVQ